MINEIAEKMEKAEKIDVRELSIGDWVCAISGTRETPPMRVVGLGESWVNLEIDPEQGDAFEFSPEEIRGIPITAEVLEKLSSDRKRFHAYIVEDIRVRPIGNGDYQVGTARGIIYAKVRHIHELQHALRLAKVGKEIEL